MSYMKTIRIADNLWRINESNENGPYVDAYLVVGSESALLIDTLMLETGLYDAVRAITDLPLEVVLTHGHGDHAGRALPAFFEHGVPVRLHAQDARIANGWPGVTAPMAFLPLEEGMRFHLGGLNMETIVVPGHTPGSIALFERERQWLFSGDCIGSSIIWMHIPGALPLAAYAAQVERLLDIVKPYPDTMVYPGHLEQSPVPLGVQYIKDVLTIARRVSDGVWEGKAGSMTMGGRTLHYSQIGHGFMQSFLYDPNNLCEPSGTAAEAAVKDRFTYDTFIVGGVGLHYALFAPEVPEGETLPLVVSLHGIGERGEDARKTLLNSGGRSFAHPDRQAAHPCFVLSPACPKETLWYEEGTAQAVERLIRMVIDQYPVDACRVYIVGLSMGGTGTWRLITRHPEWYAAAMPVCGAFSPRDVVKAKHMPIWAFHAADDPVVPVGAFNRERFPGWYGSRYLVQALREAGAQSVRYTEYPAGHMAALGHGAHSSWIPAFDDAEATEWLFSQHLMDRYTVEMLMPGVYAVDDGIGASFYLVEGRDKALLIDTGMGRGDIKPLIASITGKSVTLALTHAHGDHMLHAHEFTPFYVPRKDMPLAMDFATRAEPNRAFAEGDCLPMDDGFTFDLGGGVIIEAVALEGHTPGSAAFLDRAHGLCFIGDALGSGGGVFMQLEHSLDISVYRDNLRAFAQRMREAGCPAYLAGHRLHIYEQPDCVDYNPTTAETIEDMAALCDLLLTGDVSYIPAQSRYANVKTYRAALRGARMLFTEMNVK